MPEHRMLAIQVLGERKSRPAVPSFATIIEEEGDPYELRAIAQALAQIGDEASRVLLARLSRHPSVIVRRAAEEAIRAMPPCVPEGHEPLLEGE